MAKACLGAFFYVAKGNGLGKQYKLTCLSHSICKWKPGEVLHFMSVSFSRIALLLYYIVAIHWCNAAVLQSCDVEIFLLYDIADIL